MIQKTAVRSQPVVARNEALGTAQTIAPAKVQVVPLDGSATRHIGQSNPVVAERTKETDRLQKELGKLFHGLAADDVSPVEWQQPMDELWAKTPGPVRSQLEAIWTETLIRPEHTNAVTDELLFLRTFFEPKCDALLAEGAAMVPTDPKAPLPDALAKASTRFLRGVLNEILQDHMDDRRAARKGGEPSDQASFEARYARINDLLVERTRWGDEVPIRDFHAHYPTKPLDVEPEARFWRHIDRSAFGALANQLKAVHEPKDDQGRGSIQLEMRSGTKLELESLLGHPEQGQSWARDPEHVISLASAVAANPTKTALAKLAAVVAGDRHGIEGHLLRPLSELHKTPIPAAAKASAAALATLVQQSQAPGITAAELSKSLGKLVGLATIPSPHLLAAMMRLHAAIEARGPSEPAIGLVLAEAMTKIAEATGRETSSYSASVVLQSLAQLAALPDAPHADVDRLLFQLLDGRPSAYEISAKLRDFSGAEVSSADRIEAVKSRLQGSAQARIDAAVGAKNVDVPRFAADLDRVTEGKSRTDEQGLLGAYLLAKNVPYQSSASARLATLLGQSGDLLDAGLRGATPTTGLLYGGAYLEKVARLFSAGQPSHEVVGRARAFVETAGQRGAAALGIERLRQTLAILPELSTIEQTLRGPEFKSAGIDALLAKYPDVPSDPVLALTLFEALMAIVPSDQRAAHQAIADRASGELLGGRGAKARATLEPAFAQLRASLTRPPILEDRASLCDDAGHGLWSIRRRLGVETPPAIAAFLEVPTAERLRDAAAELPKLAERVNGAANAKGLKGDEQIQAELELITALLAPKFDAEGAQEIAGRADTIMREARRYEQSDRYAKQPIPEHPIEAAIAKCQPSGGKVRPREVLAQGRDHVFAELKEAARGDPQRQIEALAAAQTLVEKLGKMCEGRNSVLARVLATVGRDAKQARTPEARQLALFEISHALNAGYNTFERIAKQPDAAKYVAGYEMVDDTLALRQLLAATPPAWPKDLPEIVGRLLGNATVVAECLPKDHALGGLIRADLVEVRAKIAKGDLQGAAASLLSPAIASLTLSDRVYVQEQLARPARPGLEPWSAAPSEMKPGDGVRFADRSTGKVTYGWIGAVKESSFHMYGLGGGETILPFEDIAKNQVEIFPSRAASLHALLTDREALGKKVSVDVYERGDEVAVTGKLTAFDASGMTLLVDGKPRAVKFDEIRPNLRVY